MAQQEAAADAARVPGAGLGPKSSPASAMLDFFTIFSKGGLVLWCFQGVSDSCTGPVNALIRSVLLQVRPPRGRTPGSRPSDPDCGPPSSNHSALSVLTSSNWSLTGHPGSTSLPGSQYPETLRRHPPSHPPHTPPVPGALAMFWHPNGLELSTHPNSLVFCCFEVG